MPSSDEKPPRIDLFHKLSQASVPLVALVFTLIFGLSEVQNRKEMQALSRSNLAVSKATLEVARSNVRVSLIPFLASDDKRKRDLAVLLLKEMADPFAAGAVSVVAKTDPNKAVRSLARSALSDLVRNSNEETRARADRGIRQYDVGEELRAKELFPLIEAAQGYVAGGAPNGPAEAVRTYQVVLGKLSAEARASLGHEDLLAEAQRECKSGNYDLAARKYGAVFADYLAASSRR